MAISAVKNKTNYRLVVIKVSIPNLMIARPYAYAVSIVATLDLQHPRPLSLIGPHSDMRSLLSSF